MIYSTDWNVLPNIESKNPKKIIWPSFSSNNLMDTEIAVWNRKEP